MVNRVIERDEVFCIDTKGKWGGVGWVIIMNEIVKEAFRRHVKWKEYESRQIFQRKQNLRWQSV